MRVLILCGVLFCALPCVQAAERGGQEWLKQSDSLRNAGQDAAALDFLNSAEQQFRRSGEDCWVARCAERRARVHLDWQNPVHASEALASALMSAAACSELSEEVPGWRFALAKAKLDLGARDEARWILAELAAVGTDDNADLRLRHLAVESLDRLAQMSLQEGDYAEGSLDYDRLAEVRFSIGAPVQALDAWGWSAVCSALEGKEKVQDWQRIRVHPAWTNMPVKERSEKGVAWGGLLLQAGALNAFDALALWPWALKLEGAPGSVNPLSESKWALLRARRHQRHSAAQALAASHQAELAARIISERASRETVLSEALRLRASILASTGAHGPAYFALREADSLAVAQGRAERARNGLFESEPWLSAIGDARTRLETTHMERWRWASIALGALSLIILGAGAVAFIRLNRVRQRLRQLQQHWLPGRQHQVQELALSGARLAEAASGQSLPTEFRQSLDDFGRLATLCSQEMRHERIDLKSLCLSLAEGRQIGASLEWSLHEERPFYGDEVQLRDFLSSLIDGMGRGSCRMNVHSKPSGLEFKFDEFTERSWWREAMSLFAQDGEARHWSLVRLRCDRMGGSLNLDCDATGARHLEVGLPVYSA